MTDEPEVIEDAMLEPDLTGAEEWAAACVRCGLENDDEDEAVAAGWVMYEAGWVCPPCQTLADDLSFAGIVADGVRRAAERGTLYEAPDLVLRAQSIIAQVEAAQNAWREL